MVSIRAYECERGRITTGLDLLGDDIQGVEPAGISGDGGTWQFESLKFVGPASSVRKTLGVASSPKTTGSARVSAALAFDPDAECGEARTRLADLLVTRTGGSPREVQLIIDQRKVFNNERGAIQAR